MTLDELSAIARANGLDLSREQLDALWGYATLLKEKNQGVNLISRKDEENILDKHILHSLCIAMPQVAGFSFPLGARAFDIGAGGGLPGIPLKIVRPDLTVVLCDSIAKKMHATNVFIAALGLVNIRGVVGRAEDLAKGPEHRRQYDVIVSRAVAPLDELLMWTKDLTKPGATMLALKGGDIGAELEQARKMKNVQTVTESLLGLAEYPAFGSDEKKIVRVLLR